MKSAFINEKNKHLKHTSIFEYSKKLFMCSNWSFECNFVIHLLMNNSLISLAPRASSRRVCLFIILRQQLLGPAATKLTPQTATCPHFSHVLPAPSLRPRKQQRDNNNDNKFVWQQSINIYVLERLAALAVTLVSLPLPLALALAVSLWRVYLQDTSIFVSCRSSSSSSCVCSWYHARQHSNDNDKRNNTQSQLRPDLGRKRGRQWEALPRGHRTWAHLHYTDLCLSAQVLTPPSPLRWLMSRLS